MLRVLRGALVLVPILTPFVVAETLFHADFEQGVTYLAAPLKPGAKKIELVANDRLSEWPQEGGEGIVEGNLPSASEVFRYKRREGNTLLGVSDIARAHVRFADVRTGDLRGLLNDPVSTVRGKKFIKIQSKQALFGNHSLAFDGCDTIANVRKHLEWDGRAIACRFYVEFSRDCFRTEGVYAQIFATNMFPFFVERVILQGNPNAPVYLGFARLDGVSTEAFEEQIIADRLAIQSDVKYCVEYRVEFGDSNTGVASLWINGRQQIKRRSVYMRTEKDSGTAFMWGSLSSQNTPVSFMLDEVVIGDGPIGPLRSSPKVLPDESKGSLGLSVKKEMNPDRVHWQINSDNAWPFATFSRVFPGNPNPVLPFPFWITLSDSVNPITILEEPQQIPTGIQPGREYLARARMGFSNLSN